MLESWLSPDIQVLLWEGLQMTILLTLMTALLAMILGIAVVWLQQLQWGKPFARVYIEIFRSIPALILIIIFAYGIPNFFDLNTRRAIFFQSDVMLWLRAVTHLTIPYYAVAASLALTLNTSAYLAELLRAGMNSLDQNHLESARTLGATPTHVFASLMLPHALSIASPSIITRLVHHLKNTALASFVAVPELFKATQTAISRTFHALELLVLGAVLYLLLAWLWAILLTFLLPTPPSRGAV